LHHGRDYQARLIGGLCEKSVTLLVTLRVRCLVSGDSAWAEAVAIVMAPRPSGTGSGRLDADGEDAGKRCAGEPHARTVWRAGTWKRATREDRASPGRSRP